MRRLLSLLALVLGFGLALTGCAPTAAPAALAADTVIIDVRTPEEFAAGHLEGAVNIDVTASDFDALVSELDADGSYAVYCRTGNRSAQAVERMAGLGFDDVVDLGSLEEAEAATDITIVTG
ncbi:MAG: rhodanese-like domain-containing protein [Microbacterium sp.]|uniref:rhodanese-like domain-containing protein n=1 Tax=unclassified Microbacterium TaxID=2609290 RepID=UPI000DB8CCD9|nr:rhodanese-like domain-containing protein [Microbacterium sp.]PZU41421.1 MAG: rhodanese-like domain-containing protein [Microbacterium sp.]